MTDIEHDDTVVEEVIDEEDHFQDDGFFFGCLDDEPDPRNYSIAQFIPKTDIIEDTQFMLNLPELEIIKNQYSNGACVGFASAMALSVAEYQLSNKWIVFDPYVVYGSRGSSSKGMQLQQGPYILLHEGGFFESDFGESGDGSEINSLVSKFKKQNPDLVEKAKTYAIEGYAEISGSNEIKTALKNNMPVIFSYNIVSDFYSADAYNGKVPYPHKSTTNKGSHAMLIVGWCLIDEVEHWIVINSWGTTRGKKGIYFIDCRDRQIKRTIAITNNITPAKAKCKTIKFTIGKKTFLADGEEKVFESVPYIKDDRTYLPVRFVAENLGASVEWDANNATATIRSEEATIIVTENSKDIVVNGKIKEMDVAPEITAEGRMMLPIRFIAEALNCKVEWSTLTSTATIIAL